MAAKTKQSWVDSICELDNNNTGLLGEIQRDDLDGFTIGQLKALYKEMVEDLAQQQKPVEGEGKELAVVEDGTNEEKADSTSKFMTMCGSEFNPKTSGECFKQCSVDFPEAFEACLAEYKKLDLAPTKKRSTSTIGKTTWGHLKTAQGGRIDDFFFEGNVGTLKEVAEFSNGKEARCLHHMKHLVYDLGIELLYGFRKEEVGEGDAKKVSQEKVYWWAESDKRRNGEKLIGKSAYAGK